MTGADRTVVLLGDYDYEYFREVSLRDGLEAQGRTVRECRFRGEPLFIGPKKLLVLPLFYYRIWRRLRSIAAEEDGVDAILVTKFNLLVLPIAAFWARRLGATLVYDLFVSLYRTGEMRGFAAWKIKLVYWLERWLLRLPDYHLTETAAFETLYSDLYGLPKERIVGVPVGADETHFSPRPDDESPFDSFTVVYWGNFLPHHGLDTVVDAAASLHGSGIDFVFLGEGPEKDRIEKRVADLDHVEFRGRVAWAELSQAASGADVALGIFADDPRSKASITNKVSEALAAGTAVVTMRSPATEEWFTDGDDVVLVPPEDPDALAEALVALWEDDDVRRSIARAGRKRYEDVFSVEHIGQLLVDRVPL